MRALLLIHRYLGIVGGALMVSWCASGFVMMYVSYPRLTESQRTAHLEPIAWGACAGSPKALPRDPASAFRLEMLAGRLVLREERTTGPVLLDWCTGTSLARLSPLTAATVAKAYFGRTPRLLELREQDQWTVSGQFRPERPLFHFVADDEAHSEAYVSSVSGRVVQVTTRRQRFWNWLGAIPHWLYVFELRRHPQQWSTVVIAGSLLGCFLTITGLYLGVQRLPRLTRQALFGARTWHHLSGLVFGIFTLSWLGSGLLSLQPFGLLESSPLTRQQLQGSPATLARLHAALCALPTTLEGRPFVSLESQARDGVPFFIAYTADGRSQRLDEHGLPAPFEARDWSALSRRLGGSNATRLTDEDAYLFAERDEPLALPVVRLTSAEPSHRVLYFDAQTGALRAQFDRNARAQRWVDGLHRLDLLPLLRRRPLWDVLVLALLTGVSSGCLTGAWLAYRGLFVRKRQIRVPKGDVTRLARFIDRTP